MSMKLEISLGAPAESRGFTVEYQLGCMIVRGPVLVDVFAALAGTLGQGAAVCARLSKRFGATFVAGMPGDLAKLYEVAPPRALPMGAEHLPPAAVTWLQVGDRGTSSEAMFDAAFGGHFASDVPGATSAPSDVSDFVRCRRLVDEVPEVLADFERVAGMSPAWARWVAAWPRLCETLDSEVTDWRTGGAVAPQTQALIEALSRDGTA